MLPKTKFYSDHNNPISWSFELKLRKKKHMGLGGGRGENTHNLAISIALELHFLQIGGHWSCCPPLQPISNTQLLKWREKKSKVLFFFWKKKEKKTHIGNFFIFSKEKENCFSLALKHKKRDATNQWCKEEENPPEMRNNTSGGREVLLFFSAQRPTEWRITACHSYKSGSTRSLASSIERSYRRRWCKDQWGHGSRKCPLVVVGFRV